MRVIAYLVALIYAHQAIAGLPPTKLGGQSGTAFTNFNFFTPANQSTKVTGGGLIETGNRNLLINGEFEAAILAGPAILGWTSTGTAAPDLETSGALFGKQSLRFDTTAQTVEIYQDYTPATPVLVGTNAQIKFSARATVAGTACVRQTGSTLTGDSNCVTILGDDVKRDYVIPTKFGTGSTGVNFSFPSSTATILIDSVELGDRLDVSDVQQARLHGSVRTAPTTNCNWTTTSTSMSAFPADADCPVATTTGSVTAPATKVPGFVLKGDPGNYAINFSGRFVAIAASVPSAQCEYAINDGSTTSDGLSDGSSATGATATASIESTLSFKYIKTTSADVTIQLYADVLNGTSCSVETVANATNIDVYYYPPANKIFSTDSLGWFIDANIGGATIDLGLASVASYTEITNAGLDLVVNTAKGSQSAKILCSGTNPPTGTTCSAGSESVGISFVIPKSGQYEVCADFTHNGETSNTANSVVATYFQLVETPVNAQTNTTLGGVRVGSTLASINANTAQSSSKPFNVCSVFNFTSSGEKAVRLMYEQVVASAPLFSLVLADRSAASGQRDIHFTVKPAINLERINGSFAQIEDSLKTIPNHNYVINGNFDFWQRGTSLGALGGSTVRFLADRFYNQGIDSSTVSVSRQTFVVGQSEVPNNPEFFQRTVVSSVAGAGNGANIATRLEDVTKLSGKTVTVSFWAKADATRPMAVEFEQNFGTGGSPSAVVNGIGVKAITLTTSWQKFTQTVTLPSVSGKTLGTNLNDFLLIRFWYDCGSTFANLCGSIGQQSGTFDIAQVKLEEGINATPFVLAGGNIEGELAACQRFYQRGFVFTMVSPAEATAAATLFINFKTEMRSTPIVSQIAGTSLTNSLVKVGVGSYTPTSFAAGTATPRAATVSFGGSYTLYSPISLNSDIIQADAEL